MKFFLHLILLVSSVCFAQIPAYYSSVDFNASGNDVMLQLSNLITTTHTTNLPYTSNILPDTWDAVKLSDLEFEGSNNVLLIYGWNDNDSNFTTDRTRHKDLSCHTSSCSGLWVREHVYPRSLGTPNLGFEFAGADAHNLRAIDNSRNNTRSNRKFEDGSGQASYITATGNWYPGDEWKGDVARMMMYMYLRYPTQCNPLAVGVGSASFSQGGDMPDIFLIWNEQDPVSEYEMTRNNVLQNMQGNRNPFIDNPYLATLIWNGPIAQDTWNILSTNDYVFESLYIYPTITYDLVTISNQQNTYNYSVYNSLGQLVNYGVTSDQIDLSNQVSGMYLIRLGDGSQDKTFKVLRR